MSTIAERTFVINTQAVGTIELTATLETANASLASYITENRTYLDGVRASIDSDLSALTAEVNTERGTAYNKDFGSVSGSVAEGNHLHDDRYYAKTDVNDLLELRERAFDKQSGFNLAVGTQAGTVAAGNDLRFTDAREPVVHQHTKSAITDFDESDYATAAQGVLADSALQQAIADNRYYTQDAVDILLRGKESVFTRNSGFNLPLGTTINTIAKGDHTHEHFEHEVTGVTTRADSAFNTLTSKNYVDEKVRQLLESQGFVFKHNEMLLLDGDDHLQYHTDARGDARYPLITSTNANFISVNSRIDAQNPRFDTLQSDLDQANVDINQERTDRTFAESVLRQELGENIQDVDDAAVHILGDQVIDGEKKFTGNVIVEGEAILQNVTIKSQSELDVGDAIVLLNAGETGTPSVNAGFEIERGTAANAQLLFDEANDQFVAGIVGALKALATEDYVDDGFLSLDGGTVSGNVELDGNLVIDRTGITPNFSMQIANVNAMSLFAYPASILLRNYDADGAVVTEMRMFAGYTLFDEEVRGPDPVNDAAYTPKKYVEDNFLKLNGNQSIVGETTMDNPNGSITMNINTGVPAGTQTLEYQTAGQRGGLVYRTAAGTTPNVDSGTLRLRLYDIYDGSVKSELAMGDGRIDANVPFFVPSSTNANTATTRGYVDGAFLSLDGGTIDGDLRIKDGLRVDNIGLDDGTIIFINDQFRYSTATANTIATANANTLVHRGYVDDNFLSLDGGIITGDNVAFPRIEFDVDTGKSGGLTFKVDGTQVGSISGSSEFLYLLGPNGSYFSIQPNFTFTNKELRGPTPTNNASYTPKSYVDDNFLSLDGGTLSDNLIIDYPTGNPLLTFKQNGTTVGRVQGLVNRLQILGAGSTAFELYDGLITCNAAIRGVNSANTDSLTTRGYVDDTFLPITGGTLTGALDVSGLITMGGNILMNKADPTFYLNHNGVRAGALIAGANTIRVRQYSDTNTFGAELSLGASLASFNTDVDVDGDQNITGVLRVSSITNKNAGTHAYVTTGADSGKLAAFEIEVDSGRRGLLYADDGDDIKLAYYSNPATFTQGSRLTLSDGLIAASSNFTVSGALTTGGSATIGGNISVTHPTGDTNMFMNAISGKSPVLRLQRNSVTQGWLAAFAENLQLVRFDSNGVSKSSIALYDDRIDANTDFNVDGDVDVSGSLSTGDNISMDKASGNVIFDQVRNGNLAYRVNTASTFTQITRYDSEGETSASNQWNVYLDRTTITQPIQCIVPTTASQVDSTLVTRNYIDDFYNPRSTEGASVKLDEATANGTSGVSIKAANSMAGDYTMQMPNSIGVVGSRLECVSISGTTMIMDWVSA